MKLRNSLILFAAFLLAVPASAQDKVLTMKDAIMGNYSYLNPADINSLQWIKGTNTFSYKSDDGVSLMRGYATKKDRETIVTLEKLNNAIEILKLEALKAIPLVTWLSDNKFVFRQGVNYITYELAAGKAEIVTTMQDGAANADLEMKSLNFAYTLENDLYVGSPGGETRKINEDDDPNDNVIFGQSVHRNEFGIEKGTFWSFGGKKMAFYRMDQTMVTDYPIMDVSPLPASVENIKYPMAGGTSHHVNVGVYDLESQKVTYLQVEGPEDQYLTNISWSPDDKYVFVAVLNREQNHMWLNKYDASTGDYVKTLFEEKHEKYVEPLDPMIFLPGNSGEFLWFSQRDGFRHLYHYNADGKLIRQVTKGDWVVTDFLGYDKSGKTIYYVSTQESPMERHPYSISIKGGNPRKLSNAAGVHKVKLSDDASYILDSYSSLNVPKQVVVNDTKGKFIQTLLDAKNPLTDYKLGETKLLDIKADDGTKLYARLITPPNLDPAKKYPVVVYVYNGPHVQLVTNSWLGGSNLWMQYMAQHGYIVFTVDGRGSYNRGRDFEQAIFRKLAEVEMEDQLNGVEYLKSLPYVDADRIGVHGWSYGGFMTTSLMLRKPGVFKVGVAGGPVIDWKYYEVMYTERYMDTPQENPEGYKENSLLNHLGGLEDRLLLIHGTVDDVVVWQHSLAFVKKAVDEGKQIDYFVYPGHPHNVHGPDRVHLMQKVTHYFDDFLK